jgi:DNA-binding transcriptional ArsR family regulator
MGHRVESEIGLLSAAMARSVAETMQALAASSRVRILSRLGVGCCSVGELSREIGMDQSAVSQQLRVLRHLGLVVGERDGRRVMYALHDDHVRALLSEAVSHTEHLRFGRAARSAAEAAGAEPRVGPSLVTPSGSRGSYRIDPRIRPYVTGAE